LEVLAELRVTLRVGVDRRTLKPNFRVDTSNKLQRNTMCMEDKKRTDRQTWCPVFRSIHTLRTRDA